MSFQQFPFLIIGFALGVVAQGVAICTATILQQEVDDEYRGRVFSINDMLYNATFVLGAAVSALFMPANGKSYAMLAVVAIGYLLAAAGYLVLNRQVPGPAASGPAQSLGRRPAQQLVSGPLPAERAVFHPQLEQVRVLPCRPAGRAGCRASA